MLLDARSPAMPCAPVAWRTSPFRHRTSSSGPEGQLPVGNPPRALMQRHMIGRARVKFYGHQCAFRSTGLVRSVFDKLGLLCLYVFDGHFRIDQMPYDLTVNG